MLEEAVAEIRLLWEGDVQSHHGKQYTVENARLYTLSESRRRFTSRPPGRRRRCSRGRIGDGLVSTAPKTEIVETFKQSGGKGKPKSGQVAVRWAKSEAEGRKTALEIWPNAAIPGELDQELPMPAHFEQAAKLVTEDAIARQVVCGPDAERHIAVIQKYVDAGFDHVYIHQIGPDPEGFMMFYKKDVLPRFN
jgi:coenzyme F420-dependent glucose-6-phosphate dehydrogenase